MVGIKWFCLFLLISFSFHVYSDAILQREQELTEVQTQIEEQRRRAEEAEEQRRTAEQTRQQAQSQLNMTQRRVQELNAAEQNLRRSLELSRNLLNQTETKMTELQFSTNRTMLYLLLEDQAETKLHKPKNATYLLSILMQRLIVENTKVNMERLRLSGETVRRTREVQATVAQAQTEQDRLQTITTNLVQIDTDIVAFERQKQEFQNRADERERSAIALQELINSLRAEARITQFTFEFPSGFEAPVTGRVITNFGPRRHERYDISTISNGIAISIPENTPVRAFADGEVVFADWFTGAGRMIIIDHKNGFHTVYSYNNALVVQRGDMVAKGQLIAESGRTGSATEPSLHFEIRRNGLPVNPLDFITP